MLTRQVMILCKNYADQIIKQKCILKCKVLFTTLPSLPQIYNKLGEDILSSTPWLNNFSLSREGDGFWRESSGLVVRHSGQTPAVQNGMTLHSSLLQTSISSFAKWSSNHCVTFGFPQIIPFKEDFPPVFLLNIPLIWFWVYIKSISIFLRDFNFTGSLVWFGILFFVFLFCFGLGFFWFILSSFLRL